MKSAVSIELIYIWILAENAVLWCVFLHEESSASRECDLVTSYSVNRKIDKQYEHTASAIYTHDCRSARPSNDDTWKYSLQDCHSLQTSPAALQVQCGL